MIFIDSAFCRWSSILLVAVWCRGISSAQQAMVSPTVVAVQGDRYDGVDLASKFLTGCRRKCTTHPDKYDCSCSKSTYHVPDSWSPPEHGHLDQSISDYGRFFRDKRAKDKNGKGGEDEEKTNGIDRAQIVFYAGHGGPERFCSVREDPVKLRDFSLGDAGTRYLFMLSCNVFAHGPRSGAGDFNCPHLFDASQFQPGKPLTGAVSEMANVFYSWGNDYGNGLRPLNPPLRLACGGSSLIGGSQEYSDYPTHLFWYYVSVLRLNPADAWLVSLFDPGKAEPLCMSRGDSLKTSGLADGWFKVEPLAEGKEPPFIFAEYPMEAPTTDPLVQAATSSVSAQPVGPPRIEGCISDQAAGGLQAGAAIFPVLPVGKTSLPAVFDEVLSGGAALKYGFRGGAASVVAENLLLALFPPSAAASGSVVRADDICVEKNPASDSMAISWRPTVDLENLNTAGEIDAAATDLLLRLMKLFEGAEQQEDPEEKLNNEVYNVKAIQMRVDWVKKDSLLEQPKTQSGCLFIRKTRSVDVGNAKPVRIFGEGSETFIGRCPAALIRIDPDSKAQSNPCERKGSPLAIFVYTNREAQVGAPFLPEAKLRRTDEVIQEARSKMELPPDQADRYTSVNLRKGYRAAPSHCAQGEMRLVYQVDFASDDPDLLPRTVEVLAQEVGDATGIEGKWDCASE